MQNNPVDHPSHYTQGKVECIDAIEAALGEQGFLAFLRGQVIKYVWRCDHKGEQLQDLEKAAWYLARAKQQLTPPPMVNTCNFAQVETKIDTGFRLPVDWELRYLPYKSSDLLNKEIWSGAGWYIVEFEFDVPFIVDGKYFSYEDVKEAAKKIYKLVNKA